MKHNRKIIYLAGFLFALPLALATYINSSFIASFVGESKVAFIYTLGSLVALLGLLISPSIFRKLSGYKFLLTITLLDATTFAILATTEKPIIAIITFILGICLNTLIIFSLDEFLKISSKDSNTGITRGTYIALCNMAWILAQIFSGTVIGNSSFKTIYLINFFIMIIFFIVLALNFKHIIEPKYDKINILKTIKKFFNETNLIRSYKINFLLQFFFSWMVIYTPIYLRAHLNFTWSELGIIFAIMLIPFSLVPIHLGKYLDKFGERKTLIYAFILLSFSTIILFLINSHNIFIWAILLFITRVGAASIEVAADSYFFKHIQKENEEFIGVYRNANPVAYIIGPLFASLFLWILPAFNYLYIVLGILMLSGIYISSTIKKTDF